jgi:hypothetical protein
MKKGSTMLWVLIIGGGSFAFYKYYWDSQKRYAQLIIKNGYYKSDISNLLSYDKAYVKAWAKAAQIHSSTFSYNGVDYNTNGGLIVKAANASSKAPMSAPIKSANISAQFTSKGFGLQ